MALVMSVGRTRILAVAVLAVTALATAAPVAFAQDGSRGGISSLGDLLFPKKSDSGRRGAPPPVARYVAETGEGFTLDRSSARTLLRFDNSFEVWVLQPVTGPRGDMIYKSDSGRVMLRDTRVGGMTIFTPQRLDGAAAALTGQSTPIRLAAISPGALYKRMYDASNIASNAARRQIAMEGEATPESSALIADSAMVAAGAIARMAQRKDGRMLLAKFDRVFIAAGPRPTAIIKNRVLVITVSPGMGYAGRPSSERISAMTISTR